MITRFYELIEDLTVKNIDFLIVYNNINVVYTCIY